MHAVHAREVQARGPRSQTGSDLPAPPPVGNAAVACRPVDDACDSNHAKAGVRNPRRGDARADFPGAASQSHCPAHSPLFSQWTRTTTADTGRIDHAQASIPFPASLMGDKQLASRAMQGAIWLQNEVLTREAACFEGATRPEQKHSPRGEPCRAGQARGQEQTRSCVLGQDEADGPVPGADSIPIG